MTGQARCPKCGAEFDNNVGNYCPRCFAEIAKELPFGIPRNPLLDHFAEMESQNTRYRTALERFDTDTFAPFIRGIARKALYYVKGSP